MKKPAGEDTTLDASEHPLRHAPAPPANAHAELLLDDRSAPPPPSHHLPEVDPQVYEIEGEHARGGLGRILRAWDRRLDRPVAIKQLLQMHPHSEARFVREALLTARLQHPSIVPVMEAGRWPTGEPFYSMKLVTGQPLSAAIAETHSLDERLALLPRVLAAAEAIGYAHSQHIIHRDLKPANILLGPFGETLVIDWGLAKELGAEPGEQGREDAPARVETAAVTMEGSVVGTPAFMPPEQARGDEVDERADVYALGAVLYAVFAAKPPYRGSSSQEILRSVVAGPPPSIELLVPGLPFELATIIRTAMARQPSARYPTARELSADLRRFETGQLVSAQAYSPLVRFRRWLRRHRATVTVASILGAALLITGVAGLAAIISERNRSERARAVAQARSNQLILSQARNVLERDPTSALAWLKTYPLDGADGGAAFDLAVQAASRPIALHVLAGHTSADLTGTFCAGGSRFISGGADKTLRLWDLTTGREIASSERAGTIRVIRSSPDGRLVISGDNSGRVVVSDVGLARSRVLGGHVGPITDIAALPDGRRLVSAGDDGTIRVWDVDQGSARVLQGHKGSVYAIALSPDGASLASAGWDHTVRSWDLASGRDRLLGAHASEVSSVAFSPDGVHVASAGLDGVICLWSGGAGCRALEGHDGVVQALAFSPDGKWIASAGRDKTVRLWSVADGARRVLRGHTDEVLSIAFAPDGRSLVSGSLDGTVRIWSLDSDESTRLVGHRAGIKIDRVLVSPDGKRIVSLADDGELRVWPSLATGRVLHGHRDLVVDVAFSPDQRLVATSSRDKTIRVWDLASGESRVLAGHTDLVLRAWFSPDGKRIVSTSLDNTVRSWDVVTGQQELLATKAAYDIRFLPDGRFAARGNDELVSIFDLRGGSQRTLRGHASQVMAIAVAPDRRSLVSGDQRGMIRVWDVDSGEGRPLASQPEGVNDLAFSPDGNLIASVGNDKRVRLWNAATGDCRTWGPLSAAPQRVVFSSDGQWLAADSDRTIRAWNLRTGESRELAGHTAAIKRIAFAAGNLLVSVARDHTVRLWDPATGAQAIVHDHGSQVRAVTASTDGTLIATGSADTTAWIWPVDAARLLPPEPVKLHERIAAMSSAAVGLNDQVGTPRQ